MDTESKKASDKKISLCIRKNRIVRIESHPKRGFQATPKRTNTTVQAKVYIQTKNEKGREVKEYGDVLKEAHFTHFSFRP